LSSLADRIKIARKGRGDDINLSIQYVLNCGTAGSCHGGNPSRLFQFIKSESGFVPYDTCQPYLACSQESTEGFCPYVDTTCNAMNTCRTCSTVLLLYNKCEEINFFPNATIAEYGVIQNGTIDEIKAEIFARGPVVAGVSGHPLTKYTGGIFRDTSADRHVTHSVSIVGWGTDSDSGDQYWIVRNSWGQYFGEMGYFRVLIGSNILGIETRIHWATPGSWTETNFPCYENGKNCGPSVVEYIDPSHDIASIQRRLKQAET
jgi:cathepsin X